MISAINAFAESWFRYIASASLQAAILALMLLTIVWIGRRWSPALRHALLMIALIKFAIPPMLSLPTGLFYHVKPIETSQAPFPADAVVPVVREALWPVEPPAAATTVSAAPTSAAPAAGLPKPSLTVNGWLVLVHLQCGMQWRSPKNETVCSARSTQWSRQQSWVRGGDQVILLRELEASQILDLRPSQTGDVRVPSFSCTRVRHRPVDYCFENRFNFGWTSGRYRNRYRGRKLRPAGIKADADSDCDPDSDPAHFHARGCAIGP